MSSFSTGSKTAVPSDLKMSQDSKIVNPDVYLIDGSSYIKLRDVADMVDFGLTWDGTMGTVIINTAVGYTAQ